MSDRLRLYEASKTCRSSNTHSRTFPFELSLESPFLFIVWPYAVVACIQAYRHAIARRFKLHRRWIMRLAGVFQGVAFIRPICIVQALIVSFLCYKCLRSGDRAIWNRSSPTILDERNRNFNSKISGWRVVLGWSVALSSLRYGSSWRRSTSLIM